VRRVTLRTSLVPVACALAGAAQAQADALPSWNDGPAKRAIVKFVTEATRAGAPGFVAPEARLAVFDNDGTLWSEQPAYFQLLFGEEAVLALLAASHAGMTSDEFASIVSDWIAKARHPTKKVRYTDLVYRPMLELLAYLRANGFKTDVVSGGGIEFMRPWAEKTYGIPPEQVIGSSIKTRFELAHGRFVLRRLPEVDFVNDGPGKPVGIYRFTGRRPVFAFGNSDGDREMLEWTAEGPGPRFAGLVHHTDAEREWAYDRKSAVGKLDRALDEATQKGWAIVDMKSDWQTVYPEPAPE